MNLRPVRRTRARALALSLSALLMTGSLSFAATTAAHAAPDDSSVTIPLPNVGDGAFVTVSKTKDLADGEEITVSGRFGIPDAASYYVINQAGTEYRPGPYGGDVVEVREGAPIRADVTPDPTDAQASVFSTNYTIRAELTHAQDGTRFDGRVQQLYLVLGGGGGDDISTVGMSEYGPGKSFFVPLTFEGGAAELSVDTPVTITDNPSAVPVDPGQTVTFEGGATGDPAPTYQWELSEDNGESWAAIPGANSTVLTRTAAAADDGQQFRLKASNRTGKAYTASATLTVNLPETSEPAPYDPSTVKLVSDGSWVHVEPLTGLVDGQDISIEAHYSTITENYADSSPHPHLPIGQIDSATTQSPRDGRPGLLLGVADDGRYSASGSYAVSRYVTSEDGATTDCLVTQCYVTVGGQLYEPDYSGYVTDPSRAAAGILSLGHPTLDSSTDVETTRRLPIFFEGTELTPPAPPARNLPEFTTQPGAASVTEGYAVQFEVAATGDPAPTFQWQRSVDGGETWQTIRGATSATLRVVTTLDLNGYQYRARAMNEVGVTYSDGAALAVTAGSGDGNNPGADFSRRGVTLDWTGSIELQKRSPAYTPNYYSAGVSEGNKATYKNKEDDAVIVFRANNGLESVQTYETVARHLPPVGSAEGPGIQLVRLTDGAVTNNDDGGATVRWDATWSINFYGGLVPFTLSNPVLTWDAHGNGTLRADLSGYGSSMDDPTVKHELDPVLGARIATFSNATIDAEGNFSATPDWEGVEIETPDGTAEQDRSAEGWGSWPAEFVEFQFETGLSSYWYTSGGAADPHKAPSPFTVSGLYGYEITRDVPEAPEAPTVAAVSGTELDVSWSAPDDGGSAIVGYTVTAVHGDAVKTVEVNGATLSARVPGLEPGTEYAVAVTAFNTVGSSPASATTTRATHGPPAIPAAPTLATGEGSALVATWDPPTTDGGSPITGYDVTLRSRGGIVATRTVEGTETMFEALARGAGYTVTVTARNAFGASAESEESAPVTVEAIAPASPEAPTVTAGAGSLVAAWTVPAANGSDIIGYTLAATPKSGGEAVSVETDGLTATITGLDRGAEYEVTVIARNAIGASEPSPATSTTTLTEAPSGLVAPTVTAISGTEVLVAWTAPADDGGGVTGYEVTAYRGAEVVQTTTVEADGSSVMIGGLDRGTEYTMTVTARNEVGAVVSPASEAVRTLDVASTPEAVATLDGADGVTISWTAPDSTGGSPITEYVLTLTDGLGTVLDTRSVAPDVASVVIGGITPGTAVTASVIARNAVGDSAAGTSDAVTIPAVAPAAPAAPGMAANGDETVVVTWSEPATTGGSPITGYRVSLVGPDGATIVEAPADATTVEIGGLGFGSYTASVVAVNAIGSSAPSAASAAVTVSGAKPSAEPELADDVLFDQPSAGAIGVTVSGRTATVTVPGHEGEWIGASFHSDPVWLGWFRVADGVVTVQLPSDATGEHRLVVYAADGSVIGYADIAIDSRPGGDPGETRSESAENGGTDLAATGGDADLVLPAFALLLLLGGVGGVAFGRRRQPN